MQPNPRKTTSIRELGAINIVALRKAVLEIPEEIWNRENAAKPNKFDALDKTRHIVFRFVKGFDDWSQSYDLPIWEEWRALVEPVMAEAVAPYGYKNGAYPRIMLARMAPGGIIKPHVDGSISARWPHKIHVVLTTNKDVTFIVEPKPYHLAEGRGYEVNNMGFHAVSNRGATDRIHLIFEYYDKDQPVT
ncbi:MAG: aspartyl/asparaginyl beta-hydroxylase domain-containing protein [Alphaproteobacteria bacterium]